MPKRIQLSRRKGWRMPPNTVKVDRSTKWGNPHTVGPCLGCDGEHTREEAIYLFRSMLENQLYGLKVSLELIRGKNLACWCKPGELCHADVLLELANGRAS